MAKTGGGNVAVRAGVRAVRSGVVSREALPGRAARELDTRRRALEGYATQRARLAGTSRSYLLQRQRQNALAIARGARQQARMLSEVYRRTG